MSIKKPHPINRRIRMAHGLDEQVEDVPMPQLSQIEKFYMRFGYDWQERFYGGRDE